MAPPQPIFFGESDCAVAKQQRRCTKIKKWNMIFGFHRISLVADVIGSSFFLQNLQPISSWVGLPEVDVDRTHVAPKSSWKIAAGWLWGQNQGIVGWFWLHQHPDCESVRRDQKVSTWSKIFVPKLKLFSKSCCIHAKILKVAKTTNRILVCIALFRYRVGVLRIFGRWNSRYIWGEIPSTCIYLSLSLSIATPKLVPKLVQSDSKFVINHIHEAAPFPGS